MTLPGRVPGWCGFVAALVLLGPAPLFRGIAGAAEPAAIRATEPAFRGAHPATEPAAATALPVETVRFRRDGRESEILVEIQVEAEDGGLLTVDRTGRIRTLRPEEIVSRRRSERPFVPCTQDELARLLREEYPGYSVHTTRNYLIVYNTSLPYAQWCGGLLERLQQAFRNFWELRKMPLVEPRFPLAAVVSADQMSFAEVAKDELGEATDQVIGFYSFRSNRVLMYDLTGLQAIRALAPKGRGATVQELLSQPQAERTVATVIHEATHQISFNCGLQTRFTDCPLWFSEGLAMYFETPDLDNRSGWRTIGALNDVRHTQFRERLREGAEDLLLPLLRDDKRLRTGDSVQDAYAEAWALHYFLLKTRPEQYRTYLQLQRKKIPLVWAKPEERVREFQTCFGEDPAALEREWLTYFRRLRTK